MSGNAARTRPGTRELGQGRGGAGRLRRGRPPRRPAGRPHRGRRRALRARARRRGACSGRCSPSAGWRARSPAAPATPAAAVGAAARADARRVVRPAALPRAARRRRRRAGFVEARRRADRRAAALAGHPAAASRRRCAPGPRRTRAASPTRATWPRSTGLRARARARCGGSTPTCTRGARWMRCAERPGAGETTGVLLRLRRPHRARARRGRDAGARGRRGSDGVADLRGRAAGAGRAGRGGRGAAAAGRARRASCPRSTTTTTRPRGLRFTISSARCSSRRPAGSTRGRRGAPARGRRRARRGRAGRGRGARAAARRASRGEEIVVVHRSPAAAAACSSSVFAQYGIAVAIDRRVAVRPHPARPRAARARPLRAARRASSRRGPARLSAHARAPASARSSPTGSRPTCGARACSDRGPGARAQLGWTLGEIDAIGAGGSTRRRELAAQAPPAVRRAAPGAAPVLGAAEELDARALSALVRALAELEELGEARRGRGPDRAARRARRVAPPARRRGRGAVLIAEPLAIRARRFRAVFVCGLQEGEFPLAGAPEPFLSDERRRELAAAAGLRLRAQRRRARPRALPVLRLRLAATEPSCSATAAPTRRATWRCPRRSSPTWPSCSSPTGPTGGASGCWPTSSGRPGEAPTARELRPHRGGGVRTAGRRAPGAGAIAVADRAAPRPPQRDPVRGRARGLRRLPDEVAGRARAPARADRA